MMTSCDRLLVAACFVLGACTTAFHQATGAEPIVTTIAGGGVFDGQTANTVSTDTPLRCICAADGSVYFSEQSTRRVRRIAPGTGIITTIAGTGETGSSGVGGPAITAALNDPSGLALDAAGDLYVTDRGLGTANHRICKITMSTGILTVIAGTSGIQGFSGDGGPATAARFHWPTGLAFDASGNLYITDQRNHRVRRIDAVTKIITTVAGNGTAAFAGDGGNPTSASLNNPNAVTFDLTGNIYISDEFNHRVRKITLSTGFISTVVGTGIPGFSGDNGPATSAQLNQSGDVVMDGNDLYIADAMNSRVRLVSGGTITTVAGTGGAGPLGDGGAALSARFGNFWSVALTKDGKKDLVIADYFARRVRKVSRSPDVVSTIAGGSSVTSGVPTSMWMNAASDVAVDTAGNIFICDSRGYRIYRVAAGTGAMTVVAGNGRPGSTGDGGQAIEATLRPSNIALDRLGNLYIAEFNSPRIRRVTLGTGVIDAYAGNGTSGFSGDGLAAVDATMTNPGGLVCDANNNLLLVDTENNRIRRVDRSSGLISTIAGDGNTSSSGDGGLATSAGLNSPKDIALTASGDLIIVGGDIRSVALKTTSFITTIPAAISGRGIAISGTGDLLISDATSARVVKVAAGTNAMTVVAGTGAEGFTGDGGSAIDATFRWPLGLAITITGNLLIADIYNFRVRQVPLGAASGIGGGGSSGGSSSGGGGGCGLGSGVATLLALSVAGLMALGLRRSTT